MYLKAVLPLLALVCCQSNVWNTIAPLKSTRADVESILGKPMSYSKARHAAAYRTKTETVSVSYSTGPCHIRPSHGWNIPELTVIDVTVKPEVRLELASLNLDEGKFEKEIDPEISHLTYYTNNEDGISLPVNSDDGTLEYFVYFPKSQDGRLKCKEQ